MKVGLIQADGKIPNLALMKLAMWHRQKGDDVEVVDLSTYGFDRLYGSKIFMGGSGFDIQATLPSEIEAQIPDYEKFKLDYSIGFSSRGCIRDCGFCIVRLKEGNYRDCELNWIKHTKVLFLDNNFTASPEFKEKILYFVKNKLKVCFNQGLDIRLITPEKAELLSKIKYYDLKFKTRRLYFAFDDLAYEQQVIKGISCLKTAGINPKHLMFYILVGYNTTFEQDFYRFNLIKEQGCLPFIMLFGSPDKKLKDFARWINARYYNFIEWENYKPRKD